MTALSGQPELLFYLLKLVKLLALRKLIRSHLPMPERLLRPALALKGVSPRQVGASQFEARIPFVEQAVALDDQHPQGEIHLLFQRIERLLE